MCNNLTKTIFDWSEETSLPISDAWNLFTEPSHLVKLDPKSRIESVQADGPMAPGTVVTVKWKRRGNVLFHIDDVKPSCKFVFHYNSFPAQKFICTYGFMSIGENRTKVDFKIELNAPFALVFRVFHRTIQASLIKNAKAVIRMAEEMNG